MGGKLSIECLISLFNCFLNNGTRFLTILIMKLIKRFAFAMNQEKLRDKPRGKTRFD